MPQCNFLLLSSLREVLVSEYWLDWCYNQARVPGWSLLLSVGWGARLSGVLGAIQCLRLLNFLTHPLWQSSSHALTTYFPFLYYPAHVNHLPKLQSLQQYTPCKYFVDPPHTRKYRFLQTLNIYHRNWYQQRKRTTKSQITHSCQCMLNMMV